jgi:hypothetical protein
MSTNLLQRLERLETAAGLGQMQVLGTTRDEDGRLMLAHAVRTYRQNDDESPCDFCQRIGREIGNAIVMTPEELLL